MGEGVTVFVGVMVCMAVGEGGTAVAVALGAAVGWVQALRAKIRSKMRILFRCFIWITLP